MGKEIYIAGKIDSEEVSITELSNELEDRGHRLPLKWWEEGRLPKPYLDYPESSAPAAEDMIRGAYDSEVFILIPEDRILGAAVELGAALGSLAVRPEKEIIIVKPAEVRQSVFYAHPAVIAINGLSEIRHRSWY